MNVAVRFTEPYFTTAETAEKLGITTDSVKKYCNSDPQRLKGEKVGNSWMIPQSEIKRYLKEECSTGRPKNGR